MPRESNGYDGPQRASSRLAVIRDPKVFAVRWTVFRRRQTSRVYFRGKAIRLQHAGRSAADRPGRLTHLQPVSLSTPNGDHVLAESRHLVHVNDFRRFRTPSRPRP
jgi:hypothetical protein